MTVLFVDTEHDRVRDHPDQGPAHRARIDEARERLAGAAGQPCLVRGFAEISLAGIEETVPAAMVIGGNITDWAEYSTADLSGLLATIRAAPAPILGICVGHQLIGLAHGAPWGPLGGLEAGEVDPDPRFAPGQRKQRGFQPVQIDPRCALFRGIEPTAVFFQSHYWQLRRAPRGFVARASSQWSPIQAIEQVDRPVFGVQFHPERYDAEHSQGETVLQNFFALAQDFAIGATTAR